MASCQHGPAFLRPSETTIQCSSGASATAVSGGIVAGTTWPLFARRAPPDVSPGGDAGEVGDQNDAAKSTIWVPVAPAGAARQSIAS
jgi:hypothetical protein